MSSMPFTRFYGPHVREYVHRHSCNTCDTGVLAAHPELDIPANNARARGLQRRALQWSSWRSLVYVWLRGTAWDRPRDDLRCDGEQRHTRGRDARSCRCRAGYLQYFNIDHEQVRRAITPRTKAICRYILPAEPATWMHSCRWHGSTI